jgi:hypothetical protein
MEPDWAQPTITTCSPSITTDDSLTDAVVLLSVSTRLFPIEIYSSHPQVTPMVRTAINPAVETAATARSATESAIQTNELQDIENAISEWENIVQILTDGVSSEDQADILASYANTILLRWNLTHQVIDIRTIVSSLESALAKLPHSATNTRYDLLIRLASARENWYQSFKDSPEVLLGAIQYWEDAYGLAVIVRRTREAV